MIPPYTFDAGIEHECTVKAGHSPFWLTDPETLARIRAAVSALLGQSFWAVQDDCTMTASLEWLAGYTCGDVALDPCLIPLVQALTAIVTTGTARPNSGNPLDLLDATLAGLTAFESRPESAQAKFLASCTTEEDFR
ncbi:hypothetical protein [Streptomyces sp. H39-C1]|uniref:hypothetical protein n=1 Tax=Streptomyces sp. H39-C1 TaxID=3004355 RepID=UPI0022AF3314|nr:hypothetical protein [Streptomyces sp. H39-C1]MCZ4103045.1 hypothetical protein [Streptomyces sp. H39-C1]